MTTIRALASRSQRQRHHHTKTALRAFYACGERAWQQYRRDGIARPSENVFDAIAARAQAVRVRFEFPRIEFCLPPADLADLGGQAPDVHLAPRRRPDDLDDQP